jgi:hypothetical protein
MASLQHGRPQMTVDDMVEEAKAELVSYFMIGIDEDGDLNVYRFGAEPRDMIGMLEAAKMMLLQEIFSR